MTLLGLILTIVVALAVVAAIVIFERPRARRIERDLRHEAHRREHEDEAGPNP